MRPLPIVICAHQWEPIKTRVGVFVCVNCAVTVNSLPDPGSRALEPVGPPAPKIDREPMPSDELPSRMSSAEFRKRLETDPDFLKAVMRK